MFGNYFVQALFRACNTAERVRVLQHLAPDMTSIACNRNATYALQTMVDRVPPRSVVPCGAWMPDSLSVVSHRPFVVFDSRRRLRSFVMASAGKLCTPSTTTTALMSSRGTAFPPPPLPPSPPLSEANPALSLTLANTHALFLSRFQRRFPPYECGFIAATCRDNCMRIATNPNGVAVLVAAISTADTPVRVRIHTPSRAPQASTNTLVATCRTQYHTACTH